NAIICDLVSNSSMHGATSGANWNGEIPFTGGNFATPNNTFWSRIDTFFGLCKQYGISIFVNTIDAYACQGTDIFSTMTSGQASTFGAFLANRYPASQYPGIVWMFGNDWDADGPSGSATNATPSAAFYNSLISGIAGTGDTRPIISELGFYESISTDGTS